MGLTRYFNCHIELTSELVNKIDTIIEASPVALAGFDGTGTPEVTVDRICFNGTAGNTGDPFILTNGNNASFCETNSQPYDAVVSQILQLLKTECEDFYTDTDGYDDADYAEAKFNKIFN